MRIRREATERHDARARCRIPTWQGWLEAEAAARGNEAALAALRGRARRRELFVAQLLAAESADEARHVIRHHLRPAIRRDGRVIYQLSAGGAVSDEGRVVRVSQVTDGAAFFALSLASERFGLRPLVVKGTEEFCRQTAVLAGRPVSATTGALEDESTCDDRDQCMSCRPCHRNCVSETGLAVHLVAKRASA